MSSSMGLRAIWARIFVVPAAEAPLTIVRRTKVAGTRSPAFAPPTQDANL